MIVGYFNYPNYSKTLHKHQMCEHPQKHGHARVRKINPENVSIVLQEVQANKIKFKSQAGFNDLTVEIDFNDEKFERAIFEFIADCFAKKYSPLREDTILCSTCFKNM